MPYTPVETKADQMANALYGKPEEETPNPVESLEPAPAGVEPEAIAEEPQPAAEEPQEAQEAAEPESDAIAPDEGESPSEPAPEAQASESEEVEVSSVEDLAQYLETDQDWVENLTVKQKINGHDIEVKLADALSTHRQVEAADQVLSDAKTRRSTMLEEATVQQTEAHEQLAVAAAIVKDLEQTLDAQYKDIDSLRADDPAEWTARKNEKREAHERIAKIKNDATTAFREAQQKMRERQEQAQVARLPQEQELLQGKLPDWTDEKKAGKESREVAEYLRSEGFSETEVRAASFNGRALAMAVKAMRYDRAQGKKEASLKRVIKVPKVIKPGVKPKESSKPKPQSTDRATLLYGS